jgi:hypothetical protein
MAKTSVAKPSQPDIELHPDAWERFTEFVKRIAKAGPQHRGSKPKADKPTSLPRASRKPR